MTSTPLMSAGLTVRICTNLDAGYLPTGLTPESTMPSVGCLKPVDIASQTATITTASLDLQCVTQLVNHFLWIMMECGTAFLRSLLVRVFLKTPTVSLNVEMKPPHTSVLVEVGIMM